MKLYEISEAFKNIELLLENEEVSKEDMHYALSDLNMAFDEKADNIVNLIKSLNAEAEAIKQEEKRLADRRKAKENQANNLKAYLENSMILANKKKFKTLKFSYNIQANPPSLNIENEDYIPNDFYITNRTLNKKELLNAVKDGLTITGVSLKNTESLRIR